MAETLTYDETPADAPELNADEQDSLAVGEQMQEAQDDLLAGKYKDARDLESAYLELQKKLGDRDEETYDEEVYEEAEPEEYSSTEFLNDAAAEFNETGALSEETMSALVEMSSEDLVAAYIQSQSEQQPVSYELDQNQVSTIMDSVGGEQQYNNLIGWAGENLDPSAVQGFDELVETGNAAAIEFAVAGLKAMYETQNGSDGQMITGKAPSTSGESFRSQAEVVAAMSDPRYDNDPAYRQQIINKLERSENFF